MDCVVLLHYTYVPDRRKRKISATTRPLRSHSRNTYRFWNVSSPFSVSPKSAWCARTKSRVVCFRAPNVTSRHSSNTPSKRPEKPLRRSRQPHCSPKVTATSERRDVAQSTEPRMIVRTTVHASSWRSAASAGFASVWCSCDGRLDVVG